MTTESTHTTGAETPRTPDTRCSTCYAEFRQDELEPGSDCCPSCGSRGVPQSPAEDILLPINWHDVRCLVQWAENYVHSCKGDADWERHWEALKKRIRAHTPKGAAPLTLFEELDSLREAGYEVTMHEVKPKPEAPDAER